MPSRLATTERQVLRIYALLEPDTDTVRYVGQTADHLSNRLADHIRRPGRTAKGSWVQSLIEANTEPRIVLLQEFTGYRRQAYQRETHWIRHFRDQGHPLLNVP